MLFRSYLFYNADLLEDVGKMDMKVGYVDDVNFYAEGRTFDAAYAKLSDMMTREGGGQDWSKLHNSKFEMSKLTLVGFSCRRVQDPTRPGKMKAEHRPNLSLCGTSIKPAEEVSHALTTTTGRVDILFLSFFPYLPLLPLLLLLILPPQSSLNHQN